MSEGRSPEAVERAAVEMLQQAAIDEVLRRCGGESADRVVPVLRQALLDAGLVCPPQPWLTAVAVEIAAGHRFVVGNDPRPDDPTHDVERVSDGSTSSCASPRNSSLWFSSDPKIGHAPWTEAVEHPAQQFGES